MSATFGLAWHGRRRSLSRVLLLFAVTAGAYWPIWLAQVMPASAAIAAAIVVSGVLAIVLGGSDHKRHATASGPPVETVSDVVGTPGGIWITRILDNVVEQIDAATLRPTGKRVSVGRSTYDIAY